MKGKSWNAQVKRKKGHRLPPLDEFFRFHREYRHTTNYCQRLCVEVQRIMQLDLKIRALLTQVEGQYQAENRGQGPPWINSRAPPMENRPQK